MRLTVNLRQRQILQSRRDKPPNAVISSVPAIERQQGLEKGGLRRAGLRSRIAGAMQTFESYESEPQADKRNIKKPNGAD